MGSNWRKKLLLSLAFGEVITECKKDRWPGARIKHHMKKNWIKMYDKFGLVLRIETTANNVSFFKHHRKVAVKVLSEVASGRASTARRWPWRSSSEGTPLSENEMSWASETIAPSLPFK